MMVNRNLALAGVSVRRTTAPASHGLRRALLRVLAVRPPAPVAMPRWISAAAERPHQVGMDAGEDRETGVDIELDLHVSQVVEVCSDHFNRVDGGHAVATLAARCSARSALGHESPRSRYSRTVLMALMPAPGGPRAQDAADRSARPASRAWSGVKARPVASRYTITPCLSLWPCRDRHRVAAVGVDARDIRPAGAVVSAVWVTAVARGAPVRACDGGGCGGHDVLLQPKIFRPTPLLTCTFVLLDRTAFRRP